jgi:hypothetical protein
MPQDFATTPSDPRRGVRRNRYQEGPGFLFIATQNGRPAADGTPFLDRGFENIPALAHLQN